MQDLLKNVRIQEWKGRQEAKSMSGKTNPHIFREK